jgi:hypothetical protein
LKGDDRAICELIGKMVKPKEQRIALLEVIIQMTTNLTASRKSNIFSDVSNQSSILQLCIKQVSSKELRE